MLTFFGRLPWLVRVVSACCLFFLLLLLFTFLKANLHGFG